MPPIASLRPLRSATVTLALGGLLGSYLGWLVTFDLAGHPALFYLFLASAFGSLFVVSRRLRQVPATPALILGVAMLARALVLPLPPSLSDDVYRYLWDGKVAVMGHNPYALTPDAEQLVGLRDEPWSRMSHRDVETVYPPLALSLFSISALSSFPLATYKVLLSSIDLVGCGLLLLVARRAALPPSGVVWYAWNPLVILEVAGMGHVDALGVTLVIATVLLLAGGGARRRDPMVGELSSDLDRGVRSGRTLVAIAATAAGAVLAKLVPVVALPMWARQSSRPLSFLGVASLIVAVGMSPLVLSVGVPPGLVTYGVSWEFNGPIFEPLWRAVDVVRASDGVKAVLDTIKARTGHHDIWNAMYPYVYPQLLTKMLLALGLVVVVVRSLRKSEAVAGAEWLLGGALLLQATVYPWYLLWILPFAALRASAPWLVLAMSIQFSYLPELLSVPLWPWVYLAVWLPFGAAWVWTALPKP